MNVDTRLIQVSVGVSSTRQVRSLIYVSQNMRSLQGIPLQRTHTQTRESERTTTKRCTHSKAKYHARIALALSISCEGFSSSGFRYHTFGGPYLSRTLRLILPDYQNFTTSPQTWRYKYRIKSTSVSVAEWLWRVTQAKACLLRKTHSSRGFS